MLFNGVDIAVKRLTKSSELSEVEFKNEATLLATLQHRNLVRLLGFCLEGEERILVYECLPNKSLDFFLFGQLHSVLFSDDFLMSLADVILLGLCRPCKERSAKLGYTVQDYHRNCSRDSVSSSRFTTCCNTFQPQSE